MMLKSTFPSSFNSTRSREALIASSSAFHVASPCSLAPSPSRHCCGQATSSSGRQLARPLSASQKQPLAGTLKSVVAVVNPWASARAEVVKHVISEFYTDLTRSTTEKLLAPDFALHEAGHDRSFTKEEYLRLMYDVVLPAIPDFKWGHISSYDVDEDGYTLVTVQACGHHNGAEFKYRGLPAIPASGRRITLEDEAQMVKVENGRIKEIKVFPVRGAGPRALYTALAGHVPELEVDKALSSEEQLPLP